MHKDIIQKFNNLSQHPGVYVFRDAKDNVLYIGKAKKLKNRVSSYFRKHNDLTAAKQLMIKQITDIEYTITDTEQEALLLETNLIKKHKPLYNVMLKDDKYWQYIVLDYSGAWPQIYTVRRPDFAKAATRLAGALAKRAGKFEFKNKKQARYFGPYTSGYTVKESMRMIKKIFPICLKPPLNPILSKGGLATDASRQQKGGVKTKQQPCFNYHLGRCLGPCIGKITSKEYMKIFDDIKKFILGSRRKLIYNLEKKMQSYSYNQHFEAAARIRDQITALKKLDQHQKVVLPSRDYIDIINIYRDGFRIAVNLFKIRDGKVLDKFNTLLTGKNINDEEALETFIEQYYSATYDFPKWIIVPKQLSIQSYDNITITQALRGKKAQILKLAALNAREYLNQHDLFFDCKQRKKADTEKTLKELKEKLNLPSIPYRIETYDISNIQGKHAVGAMVVFENGNQKKSEYRKFKIKLLHTPDDPRMMKEILGRRLRYLKSEQQNIVLDGVESDSTTDSVSLNKNKQIPRDSIASAWPIIQNDRTKDYTAFDKKPDLIVVDGGKTQLNAALSALKSVRTKKPKNKQLNISIIALTKKEEGIYAPNKKKPLKLPITSPALKLLMQGRDEAHRFGITYHRSRRNTASLESELDSIPCIGLKTKTKLLKKFGSINAIKKTSARKLAESIGKHRAIQLKRFLS